MLQPPSRAPRPQPVGAQVLRPAKLTPAFYRYLYNAVGSTWHWHDRRDLSCETLALLIAASGVEVYVLYVEGAPAGYVEFQIEDHQVKIVYFGLIPDFIGQGLGGFFLDWAVREAWSKGVSRVWLHTCSLDHKAALSNYLRAGFEVFRTDTQENHHRWDTLFAGVCLNSGTPQQLRRFYRRALGCRDEGDSLRLPGHGPEGPCLRIEGQDSSFLAFWVEDIEAVKERILEFGGRSLDERRMLDPEGNIIHLYPGSEANPTPKDSQ